MSSLTHYGHGVYCYQCGEVYPDTDSCDHYISDMAGVQSSFGRDGEYIAQPNGMGHHSPCHFIMVDGREVCAECEKVKIDASEVEDGE